MIRQLEERFRTIFDKTRDIIQKKQELIQENEQLQKMIAEEAENQEKLIEKYKNEIESLAEKNFELYSQTDTKLTKDNEYEMQLLLKNKQITELSDQVKSILDDLAGETIKNENYERQILFMENEIQVLKLKLIELNRAMEDQDITVERMDIQIHEFQQLIKELQSKNLEIESHYQRIQEEQEAQEDKFKSNLSNYRTLLRKFNQNTQKRQLEEKNLEKLKEELYSKNKRLDVVLVNNHKLEKKIKRIDDLENQIEKLSDINVNLKEENEKLKRKIMLNAHSDYEKPAYARSNSNKETISHAKKQQKLKISKVFADEDKVLSHLGSTAKDLLAEEDYLKEKDNQNDENFRRILEIKELERLKSQISLQENYIRELARNIEERESLLVEQKREINSLTDNIGKLKQEIDQFESDKTILEKKYEEKRQSVDTMHIKYEEALSSLPDHLRLGLVQGNEISSSPLDLSSRKILLSHTSSHNKKLEKDPELKELLSKSPQALDIKRNF